MSSLSDFSRDGNRPDVGNHPEILPFSLHAEDPPAPVDAPDIMPATDGAGDNGRDDDGDDDSDWDGDTALDDRGALDGFTAGRGDGDNGNGSDFDTTPPFNPTPPFTTGAALIRAPRGPLPVVAGFTVAAVTIERDPVDGEEDIVSAQFLTHKKLRTRCMAVGVALFMSNVHGRVPAGMTHVVVNDETGREVYRKPVLRVA